MAVCFAPKQYLNKRSRGLKYQRSDLIVTDSTDNSTSSVCYIPQLAGVVFYPGASTDAKEQLHGPHCYSRHSRAFLFAEVETLSVWHTCPLLTAFLTRVGSPSEEGHHWPWYRSISTTSAVAVARSSCWSLTKLCDEGERFGEPGESLGRPQAEKNYSPAFKGYLRPWSHNQCLTIVWRCGGKLN